MNNDQHYIPIENNPGLVRDPFSRAIINKDVNALNNAKLRKNALTEMHLKMEKTNSEVKELKTLVKDLINELRQLKD